MADPNFIEYLRTGSEAWMRLKAAAEDRSHPMRLMMLATSDASGRPDARTLVLRGASRELARLWFHTDCRSRKIDQLRQQPEVCVVGFARDDGVQLRVYGHATLHQGDEVTRHHWQQANLAIKSVYGSPQAPGEPMHEFDPRTHRLQEVRDLEEAESGRNNFLVIEIQVNRIDWLQVGGAYQRRAMIRNETNWNVEPFSP